MKKWENLWIWKLDAWVSVLALPCFSYMNWILDSSFPIWHVGMRCALPSSLGSLWGGTVGVITLHIPQHLSNEGVPNINMCVPIQHMCLYTYIHINILACAYMHVYICTCIYECVSIHIQLKQSFKVALESKWKESYHCTWGLVQVVNEIEHYLLLLSFLEAKAQRKGCMSG